MMEGLRLTSGVGAQRLRWEAVVDVFPALRSDQLGVSLCDRWEKVSNSTQVAIAYRK